MPTYNPNVPNSAQSPGLLPPQANANFNRLKTIINADHIFNDTGAENDGYHRQCTMVVRDKPDPLPDASNAVLYSKLDVSSQAQLWYYNGTNDYQLTPFAPTPTKIVGTTVVMKDATSGTIYTTTDNTFGTIFAGYVGTANVAILWSYYVFNRSSGTSSTLRLLASSPGTPLAVVNFSSGNITLTNKSQAHTSETMSYYIITESL
jgi:hypothetical protein